MSGTDFQFDKDYQSVTKAERAILEELAHIIFEAQYAPLGGRARARREASWKIFKSVKDAYKLHKKSVG